MSQDLSLGGDKSAAGTTLLSSDHINLLKNVEIPQQPFEWHQQRIDAFLRKFNCKPFHHSENFHHRLETVSEEGQRNIVHHIASCGRDGTSGQNGKSGKYGRFGSK